MNLYLPGQIVLFLLDPTILSKKIKINFINNISYFPNSL
jgi:hypothetical protein